MVGPKSLGKSRSWELAWVGGGGLPYTKNFFDAGNNFQLGISGDCRKFLGGLRRIGAVIAGVIVG